jgi:hypothetical protein
MTPSFAFPQKYQFMAIFLVLLAIAMDTNILQRVRSSLESFSIASPAYSIPVTVAPSSSSSSSEMMTFADALKGCVVWIWNGDTPSRELSDVMSLLFVHDHNHVHVIQQAKPPESWDVVKERLMPPGSKHMIWVNNSFCTRYCLAELVFRKQPTCSCGHGFAC